MKLEFKNGWNVIDDAEKAKVFEFGEGYKTYLDEGKSARECVKTNVAMAESAGFKNLADTESLKAGEKLYAMNKNKCNMLAVIGT